MTEKPKRQQKNFRLTPAAIKRLTRISKAKGGWSATRTLEHLIRTFPL